MIILGHNLIPSFTFFHVPNIDAINNTPPNSAIFLEFDEENIETIEYLQKNELCFCLSIKNITHLIYASSLGASYIIVQKELVKSAQDIANNYLFDAKILVAIEDENDIEELALIGVDGVIFSNAIVKINS